MPVFNALGRVEILVERLAAQECEFEWDLTFVDSGSTDQTCAWLTSCAENFRVPLRVVDLGTEKFDHGDTRNFGAALTKGSVIVFLTDDARPLGTNWLATLVGAISESGTGAAYCLNVVPKGTPPWAAALAESDRVYRPATVVTQLECQTPTSLREHALYCDTASALLRSLWKRHPYPRADAGEDMLLARGLREAGVKVEQLDQAPVEHVHVYDSSQLRQRALLDGRFNCEAFGRVITPPLRDSDRATQAARMTESCEESLHSWAPELNEFTSQRKILLSRFEDLVEGAQAGIALAEGRRWTTSMLGETTLRVGLVHSESQARLTIALKSELETQGFSVRLIPAAELESQTACSDLLHILAPLSEEELRESSHLSDKPCITRTPFGWRLHLFGYLPAPHGLHDRYELRLNGVAHPLDESPLIATARWAFRYRQLLCMSRSREAYARWGNEANHVHGEVRFEGKSLCTLGPGIAEVAFDLPPLGVFVNSLEVEVELIPADEGETRCATASINGHEQALVGTIEAPRGAEHVCSRSKLRLTNEGGRLTLSNLAPSGLRSICRIRSVRCIRVTPGSALENLYVADSKSEEAVSLPKVAVVVVTLSGVARLKGCLAALLESDYPTNLFGVIVVDNGASTQTHEWLEREHPEAKLLRPGHNIGFTRAANLGACNTGDAAITVFLNDDAEVEPAFLQELVRPIANQKCAATAARMNLPDGQPEYSGGAASFQGLAFGAPSTPELAQQLDRPRHTLFACGGAMAIDAEIFRAIGGFDEDFFAYYDDIDLGWRLWNFGYEVHYVPTAICVHARSATSSRFPPEVIRLMQARNATLACIKNLNDEALRSTLPALLALGSRRMWIQAKRPDVELLRINGGTPESQPSQESFELDPMAMADLVGMQDVLGNWEHWMAKRELIKTSRKRLDVEVLPLFLDPLRCVEGEREYEELQASLINLYDLDSLYQPFDRISNRATQAPGGPGCFDEIEYRDGAVELCGWLLDPESETERFIVRVGSLDAVYARRVSRTDVGSAFQQVDHASSTGFAARVMVGALAPDEWMVIEVLAERGGTNRVRMAMLWRPAVDFDVSAPPPELMLRVASVAAPRAFRLDGLRTLEGFVSATRSLGLESLAGRDVLEWGCGPGRVLEHLVAFAPTARIAATDVDREAIDWCTAELSTRHDALDLRVCNYRPPLPWPDNSFDLIVAHSVMTHLPAHQQIAWSSELGRVLREGGLLLTTTLGPSACRTVGSPEQNEALARNGISDDQHDAALQDVLPDGAYRTTFQTPDWTRQNWTGLEVLETIERAGSGSQDLVVARKMARRESASSHKAGRPILVTSAHRCGTTFIGRMLAEAPEAVYIQEPFNPHYRNTGICSARFDRFFTWVHNGNETNYHRSLKRLVELRPNTIRGLGRARNRRSISAVFELARSWRKARKHGHRALLKDPMALLSAPWLAESLDVQVVVVIRHPAGFVSSVKRLGWQTAIWDLTEQTGLGETLFPDWLERAKQLAGRDADIIDQAATFWAICFSIIDDYRRKHPDWVFVYYEDLCKSPEASFRSLYQRLGLTYTAEVGATIKRFTTSENPNEASVDETYAPIDSHKNATRWRERLTEDEIARIREITADVASQFFPRESWSSTDHSSED